MTIEWIFGLIATAFGGLNIYQFIFWRTQRDKLKAEAKLESAEANRADYELSRDQFKETKEQLDNLHDEFMTLQKKLRDSYDDYNKEIMDKCKIISELKCKLAYFKQLRCYRPDCPKRIMTNPKDGDATTEEIKNIKISEENV